MGCNCKNTITNFLGGDVSNPTTFLNCGEADGTYNNPVATDITQCVAIDNVLRVLDTYYISGSVKNSGQIVFERTVTGSTVTTDTNIANSDLTLDGNHTTDVSTYTLTFDSGSAEVLKLNGSSDTVVIGPSGADYAMPVNRGSNRYILQTDGAGATSWVASSSTSSGHYWSANTNVDYAGSISNSGFTSVGIGTEYPEHKLTVSGDIGTDAFLYHNGDDDTYVKFQGNEINLVAGGNSALKYTTADGKILLNNTNANIDLNVMGDDGSVILQTDATNNRVGVNIVPTEALHVDGNVSGNTVSADTVVIGATGSQYTMPTTRGSNRYLLQTDGAGTASWVATACCDTAYFVERFQVYDEARTDGNYKRPVEITAVGNRAKTNVDTGISTIGAETYARSVILDSAYFVVPSSCYLQKIIGWGQFESSNTITIDVMKFTLTDDESDAVAGTSIGQVTYGGGSDVDKSRSFVSTGIGYELSQGDLLMPFVKANGLSSGSYKLSAFFTLEFQYIL